ncbi:MAG: hypothetical protein IT376_09120 [Polyangiaceae bacterium]|nr:hypothetical protein [Polyangiaceae bacterium]
MVRRVGAATLLFVASGSISAGGVASLGACGGPSASGCGVEAWEGQCRLRSVTKIRESDLPAPHVVYQIIYSPEVPRAGSRYTPSDATAEFSVGAKYEAELTAHFEKHQRVACQSAAPPAESCTAQPLRVAVPDFVPGAAPVAGPSGPVGCDKLDAMGGPPTMGPNEVAEKAEEYAFTEGAAALSDDARRAAVAAAQRLRSDTTVECVAIVGQIAAGESPTLAGERARTLRQVLVDAGIDPRNLIIVTATQQVSGVGARPAEADPRHRRAYFRVLLRAGQSATR